MWYYLESDFSAEAGLSNPFGPGLEGEGSDGLPIKVPVFDHLTEEEANAENEDTPDEIKYGEEKRLERKRKRGAVLDLPSLDAQWNFLLTFLSKTGILDEDEVITRATKRSKKGKLDHGFRDYSVTSSLLS
jgi:hypothetical protein